MIAVLKKIKIFYTFFKHFEIVYKSNHFIALNTLSISKSNLNSFQNFLKLSIFNFSYSFLNPTHFKSLFKYRFYQVFSTKSNSQLINSFISNSCFSFFFLISCQLNNLTSHNFFLFFFYKYLHNFFYINIFNIVYFNFLFIFNYLNIIYLSHFFYIYLHWSFIKIFFSIQDYYFLDKTSYNYLSKSYSINSLNSKKIVNNSLSNIYSLSYFLNFYIFSNVKYFLLKFFFSIFKIFFFLSFFKNK